MDKALEYLARNIKDWPAGKGTAYVSTYEGDICFMSTGVTGIIDETCLHDFTPTVAYTGEWSIYDDAEYTKDQIYAAKRELGLIVEEKQYVGPTMPTKALEEALDAIEDDLVIYALRTQLDYAKDEKILSHHEEDIKYNKKLQKALRVVLSHYGYVEEK